MAQHLQASQASDEQNPKEAPRKGGAQQLGQVSGALSSLFFFGGVQGSLVTGTNPKTGCPYYHKVTGLPRQDGESETVPGREVTRAGLGVSAS